MKQYEIVYIIHPDLEGTTDKLTDKIKDLIESNKGKILKNESWGKRKLAYPIKRNSFGLYQFLMVEIDPSKINTIEKNFRISEEILRFLTVAIEKVEKTMPKKEKPAEKVEKEEIKKIEKEKPVAKKEKKETKKEEKERLDKIDEKLKEIIG